MIHCSLMPSWQAMVHNAAIRALIRRRVWGDERGLTRRARRLFGAPPVYRSLASYGVRREPVSAAVRGEWLRPRAALPGGVLYVHGGGFVSCSAATHRPIASAIARLTGRRVFSLDYRLAPEHRYPAALEDVLAAWTWLEDQLIPGERFAMAGDSAGGNLVLGAALGLRDAGRTMPACMVGFSPWTDLAATGASARGNDGRDVMFRYENLEQFARVYLDGMPPESPAVSPVYAELGGLPPVMLHVGSTELLLDDSRRMGERIRQAGGRCEVRVFDDVAHCWQMLVPLVPEAVTSLRDASSFMVSHLEGSGAGGEEPLGRAAATG